MDTEKHTPTDDEREALIEDRKAVLDVLNQGRTLPLDVVSAQIVMVLTDRGFRRTEVPEPSAQRIGCNICGKALPDGEPHLCSEPQGEPSDTQVEAAALVIARAHGWNTAGIHDHDTARAALRAAGGVR